MYLAQFESRNFLFEGVGNTEQQARAILKLSMQKHCQQRGARLEEFFYPDEVWVREIQPGFGFIDKECVIQERVSDGMVQRKR